MCATNKTSFHKRKEVLIEGTVEETLRNDLGIVSTRDPGDVRVTCRIDGVNTVTNVIFINE